jgi:hypothetical protein
LTLINSLCAHNQIMSLLDSLLRPGEVCVTRWVDILRRLLCMRAHARTKQPD